MTEVAVADLGGTHARFALAEVSDGKVRLTGTPVILRAADYAGLPDAWAAFVGSIDRPPPRRAVLAIAGPADRETIRFTNNAWVIRPAALAAELGIDQAWVLNDFGAVAHAVAHASDGDFVHLFGPDEASSSPQVTTVFGPGTGLGVAQVVRTATGATVIETEGGHIGFAPCDAFDDALLEHVRRQHTRVSVERVAAGVGIAAIHAVLARQAGLGASATDDRAIWQAALDGSDPLAVAALEHWAMLQGTVGGDLALAHGATRVVIAGGLAMRALAQLRDPRVAERFCDKGRFRDLMAAIPVKLFVQADAGLVGAAAAFATLSKGA